MPEKYKTYGGTSIARQLLANTWLGKLLYGDNTYTDGYGKERQNTSLSESANGQELKRMGDAAKNAGNVALTAAAFTNPVTATTGTGALMSTLGQSYFLTEGLKDAKERITNGSTAGDGAMLALDLLPATSVAKTVANGAKEVGPILKRVVRSAEKSNSAGIVPNNSVAPIMGNESTSLPKSSVVHWRNSDTLPNSVMLGSHPDESRYLHVGKLYTSDGSIINQFADTHDSDVRNTITDIFQANHPLFKKLPKEKIYAYSSSPIPYYYEVGSFPQTSSVTASKILMRNRLDEILPYSPKEGMYGWRNQAGLYSNPKTHTQDMETGRNILNKVGTKTRVLIPTRGGKYIGYPYDGFFWSKGRDAGESFIIANPFDRIEPNYTHVHEAVSHPTDSFVMKLYSPVDDKTIGQLYERVSNPVDLFPDVGDIIKGNSLKPYEARASNYELLTEILNFWHKERKLPMSKILSDPKYIRDYVDLKLAKDSDLINFLRNPKYINAYLQNYSNVLKHYEGTKEAHEYANRIRDMIKTLPAIAVGAYGVTNNASENKGANSSNKNNYN